MSNKKIVWSRVYALLATMLLVYIVLLYKLTQYYK